MFGCSKAVAVRVRLVRECLLTLLRASNPSRPSTSSTDSVRCGEESSVGSGQDAVLAAVDSPSNPSVPAPKLHCDPWHSHVQALPPCHHVT